MIFFKTRELEKEKKIIIIFNVLALITYSILFLKKLKNGKFF